MNALAMAALPSHDWPEQLFPEGEPLTAVVRKTFLTTLLLSGSAEGAEAAVREGIRRLEGDDAPEENLLWESVKAAVTLRESPAGQDRATATLPRELRRILRLRTALRHCFVLRVLEGLPRDACAHLLGVDAGQVDEGTRMAAEMLAAY